MQYLARSRTLSCFRRALTRRAQSTIPTLSYKNITVDELGMPTEPTWSVKALLESYPPPVLDPAHLIRLHKLSALDPPPYDSQEFDTLRADLGELIRLVEAVKTVELPKSDDEDGMIPDGRIWQDERGMLFDENTQDALELASEPQGGELLEHASKTADGFYLVKSERRR
ncbi:hypothetical protein FRB94_004888 [Tulasnella sp. JGI-2019a]|nr:hypothetical protein FRB93_005823 [Tulasnella sp. JGI-2019a]KAG9001235.1 hypothetical protein FRB94_004888 [Tulasnella sp. JGI-2019a]KAG9024268.1 hypothetical protein FRB95_011726 [Tulasnella sp. JGI-2019a]